jgi:hypothetical protein
MTIENKIRNKEGRINMINPAKLLKFKGAWDTFRNNHPKFPKFLEAVHSKALNEGTVIEIIVTTPSGESISSNIKLSSSDIALFSELKDLAK